MAVIPRSTPRIAFVAGGGAVKAYAFHIGVLQGLREDGFCFRGGPRWRPQRASDGAREVDIYVGSSAGGCVVASLASGHPVDELRAALMGSSPRVPTFGYRTLFVPVAPHPVRYVRRLLRRWQLGELRPHHLLEVGGLLTTAGVERYFRKHGLPTNRFGDLAAELYLTATPVNGARQVIFGPRDSAANTAEEAGRAFYSNVPISQALAAAVAVPPLFAPYAITNPASGKQIHYYDGEVREALSVHVARDAGAQFIITSSIWSPYRYDERVGSVADLGVSALAEQAIHQAIEQKVDHGRRLAQRYDRLLARVRCRDAARGVPAAETAGFIDELCRMLDYRPTPTLYVAPEQSDSAFFFNASFRFERRIIDRCIASGYRAYRCAAEQQVDFFERLARASDRGRVAA